MKTYEKLTNAIMNGDSSVNAVAPARSAAGAGANKSSSRSQPLRLCRFFFHNGHCRNGDACRFSHDANGMTREEALKTIPCPYFATGACRYGEFCELKHEEAKTNDAVCGICLENTQRMNRNFGILSCCDHTFCFSCLMEWRTEGSSEVTSRRVCPTCRKSSDYVVPSPVTPANEEEKEQVLLGYKAHCATIPCKHFEKGKFGSCPFGRDCFYAHLSKKGKDIKSREKTMQQLYEGRQRDRHSRDRDLEYITDMIIMMGLQRHLERRGRRGLGEYDDDDDYGGDIFLSDILAALLEDEDD